MQLEYAVDPDWTQLDVPSAVILANQMIERLERQMRFYFEWKTVGFVPTTTSTPENDGRSEWCVGLVSLNRLTTASSDSHQINSTAARSFYPGQDAFGFGFCSTGDLCFNNHRVSSPFSSASGNSMGSDETVWGMVVDFSIGTIFLVANNQQLSVAFGHQASAFSDAEQAQQR